jgi:hypothetical protein
MDNITGQLELNVEIAAIHKQRLALQCELKKLKKVEKEIHERQERLWQEQNMTFWDAFREAGGE